MRDRWERFLARQKVPAWPPNTLLESELGGAWAYDIDGPDTAATPLEALMQSTPVADVEPTRAEDDGYGFASVLLETCLSSEERDVLEHTVIAGHTDVQTARMLGVPRTTVESLKRSALKRLKALMEDDPF